MLIDSGLGGYIVKKQNASAEDYSTLFYYNIVVSSFLFLTIYFIAPLIASFYGKIELTRLIRISNYNILIYALSIIQYISLLKRLEFKKIALINILANIIAFFISLVLILNDVGIASLIYQQVISSLLTCLGYFIHNRYIPKFKIYYTSLKEQFSFGISLLISNLLSTISSNITSNIIAKIAPLRETGLYVQANKLQSYPNAILTNVIDKTLFPIFSRMDNTEISNRSNQLSIQLYAVFFPLFTLILLSSKYIFLILLGYKWLSAVWMFKIMFLYSYFALSKLMNRNLLKSIGETKQIFYNELFTFIAIATSLFAGSLFGNIRYILWGIVISQALSCIHSFILVGKCTKISIFSQVKKLAEFFTLNILLYSLVSLFLSEIKFQIIIFIILYILAVFVIKPFKKEYIRIYLWIIQLKSK